MVKEFQVNKSIMIFKINIVKLIDKYQKPIKLSVTPNFLKTYFKELKKFAVKISAKINRQKICSNHINFWDQTFEVIPKCIKFQNGHGNFKNLTINVVSF